MESNLIQVLLRSKLELQMWTEDDEEEQKEEEDQSPEKDPV